MSKSKGFSIIKRNPFHWDIYVEEKRIYRIRGKEHKIKLYNERDNLKDRQSDKCFSNIISCMAEVCAELMNES